ncbi:hypothetical protein ACHHYP_08648 [Achlya hypogyna]|uniref:Uncharacterized protein n=1 Tax=Achlya hypogyna TaxID=1202772 RepID=A0A1V9ZKI8_ACHHY|nr:hypothetical protein ACHHYP_08648 [Achlya hypogyna]
MVTAMESSGSRSPVKKAMRFGLQSQGQGSSESQGPLRTRLLLKVAALLEQDDSMVEFVASVVDSVAAKPLEQDTMRRAFLAQLTEAEGRKAGSSVPSSGRDRSLNVHHCREFILACVNEIVDLDETDPTFDYAETCADSDEWPHARLGFKPKVSAPTTAASESLVRPASPLTKAGMGFDYVETLPTSAPVDVVSHLRHLIEEHHRDDDCDVEQEDDIADTAFTKVRALARSMARQRRAFQEFKRQMPMEPASPKKKVSALATKRLVFDVLRQELPTAGEPSLQRSSPLKEYASKYNSFTKLKVHRNGSPTNMQRKQRALRQLRGTAAGPQQTIHVRPRPAAASWRLGVRDVALMVLVVLLAMAAADELHLW